MIPNLEEQLCLTSPQVEGVECVVGLCPVEGFLIAFAAKIPRGKPLRQVENPDHLIAQICVKAVAVPKSFGGQIAPLEFHHRPSDQHIGPVADFSKGKKHLLICLRETVLPVEVPV